MGRMTDQRIVTPRLHSTKMEATYEHDKQVFDCVGRWALHCSRHGVCRIIQDDRGADQWRGDRRIGWSSRSCD
jgi:hypothetical protein